MYKKLKLRLHVLNSFHAGPSVFSDEELDDLQPTSTPSRENIKYLPDIRNNITKMRESGYTINPSSPAPAEENDDVEQELDMFNKAIHISNIDEVS